MDRAGIDRKYKVGSIRMAVVSTAIDRRVPIDVLLNIR